MIDEQTICVVVPAYNEETLIGYVIETMPDYVDYIVVVNDCSQDETARVVQEYPQRYGQERIILLNHAVNQGVGGAIATGYKWARDNGIDVAVVMAGDAQMDPADLPALLEPVLSGRADYSKGNRLFTGEAWSLIPRSRYLGNAALSLLTKIASGYWHVADSQTGFTAINRQALYLIDWDKMYKRYGQPNDLLVRLNVYNMRVVDVPVRPVYNIGEKSGIKIGKVLFTLSWLLFMRFLWRLKEKYIVRDFHPLVFFYALGMLALAVDLVQIVRLLVFMVSNNWIVPSITALSIAFLTITGLQSIFFAMWMDMEYNRHLNPARGK